MAHPVIKIAGLAYSAYEYLKDVKKAYAPEKKKKPKTNKFGVIERGDVVKTYNTRKVIGDIT